MRQTRCRGRHPRAARARTTRRRGVRRRDKPMAQSSVPHAQALLISASGGEARMVDVSGKAATERIAVAEGRVVMQHGDARPRARTATRRRATCSAPRRIAGIMAAKRTHELIPLCHPLPLTKVAVDIEPDHALPGFVRAGDRQGHRPDRRRDGGADRGLGRVPDASTTWSRRSSAACGSKASGWSKRAAASPATIRAEE